MVEKMRGVEIETAKEEFYELKERVKRIEALKVEQIEIEECIEAIDCVTNMSAYSKHNWYGIVQRCVAGLNDIALTIEQERYTLERINKTIAGLDG